MHNTNKDKRFKKRKMEKELTRSNSTKGERRDAEIVGTASKAERSAIGAKDNAVGGNSVIRNCSDNDPSWYAASEQLLIDAYSMSFADRLGVSVNVDVPIAGSTAAPYTSTESYWIPGIFNILMAPVPGISIGNASTVNVAAKKLYTFIRHANSGAANYQAPDLMFYILAMDNCYILWNWLVRIYGVAQVYATRNAYLPDGLLQSMNVDTSDLPSHLNDLRTLINIFGSKLNTMLVPSHLSYLKRHAWLFSNVFADSLQQKAQIFIYNPSHLYQWVDNVPSGTLPYLEPIPISANGGTPWKIDGLQALVNQMMNAVFYSEDFNIMSGDIFKAYGAENCFSIPTITEEYVVLPAYNGEVMPQIENVQIPRDVQDVNESWRITQSDDENLIFNPTVRCSREDLSDNKLYNFHTDQPTPGEVAVATRLNFLPAASSATFTSADEHGTATLASCGSEIVTAAYIISAGPYVNGKVTWDTNQIWTNIQYSLADDYLQQVFNSIGDITQFDWNPILRLYFSPADSTQAVKFLSFVGDLDNYTQIKTDVLNRMNDVALLSMFGIPDSY